MNDILNYFDLKYTFEVIIYEIARNVKMSKSVSPNSVSCLNLSVGTPQS